MVKNGQKWSKRSRDGAGPIRRTRIGCWCGPPAELGRRFYRPDGPGRHGLPSQAARLRPAGAAAMRRGFADCESHHILKAWCVFVPSTAFCRRESGQEKKQLSGDEAGLRRRVARVWPTGRRGTGVCRLTACGPKGAAGRRGRPSLRPRPTADRVAWAKGSCRLENRAAFALG